MIPTPIYRALHGWRRCGKRSTSPPAIRQNTISSENRWFSRCLGCSRKQRGNSFRLKLDNPDNLGLSDKGIRGGNAQENDREEESEKGPQGSAHRFGESGE